MTEHELYELIKSGDNVPVMTQYLGEHPELLPVLMNILANNGEDSTWRAAWIFDKIHDKQPELIMKYLPALTELIFTTNNTGKKRHLLKLISLYPIPEEKMALLLNYCSEIFANAAEPVAVRVHAMQILYNIAEQEPDFSGELVDMIEHEMEFHGSAGMTSRGRKLVRKLLSLR